MSELGISPVYRHDTGFFKCIGSNYYGQDENSIELIVQGVYTLIIKCYSLLRVFIWVWITIQIEAPESPKDITVVNQQSRSMDITWNQPYDGNSVVLNYIVQYKLVACKSMFVNSIIGLF